VRHLTLIVLLVLGSVLANAEEWQHNYAVSGKPNVVVDANDGDVEVTTGSIQDSAVRGKINGGGISIEIQTGDGDVHVERS
jgi:hypothetical protein